MTHSDSAAASTAGTNLLALQRGGGVLTHKQLDPQVGRRYLDVELACAATNENTQPTQVHASAFKTSKQ